jgi:hypothetical protein
MEVSKLQVAGINKIKSPLPITLATSSLSQNNIGIFQSGIVKQQI